MKRQRTMSQANVFPLRSPSLARAVRPPPAPQPARRRCVSLCCCLAPLTLSGSARLCRASVLRGGARCASVSLCRPSAAAFFPRIPAQAASPIAARTFPCAVLSKAHRHAKRSGGLLFLPCPFSLSLSLSLSLALAASLVPPLSFPSRARHRWPPTARTTSECGARRCAWDRARGENS